MKKALLLLLCLSLCLSSIFTLTSCAGDGETNTTTTQAPAPTDPSVPDNPSAPSTPSTPTVATPMGDPVTDSQGVKYRLYSDHTYHVVGTAETYSADIIIPATYENLPVTVIGDRAFYGCSSLKSVTFEAGSKCTTIGNRAFCTDLLLGYSELEQISIPSSVTFIGEDAFYGCINLQYNTYDNANYLGNSENPYVVLVKASDTDITSCTIHPNTKFIHSSAFGNCSSLESITIPSNVTLIGNRAFSNCSSLQSIFAETDNLNYHSAGNCLIETASKTLVFGCKNSVIPTDNSVTAIGDYAFFDCSSLQSITIPSSVTTIGGWAFWDCSSLQSITIPSSVTTIGDHAFSGCSSLQGVYISDIAAWCGIDFKSSNSNPLYDAKTLYLNGNLVTNLVIPSSVTSIGNAAFAYCSSLQSITIPSSVTTIGDHAFLGCSSLQSVTFEAGSQCSTIGDGAFYNCSSMESITIPSRVTSIGDHAFYDCSSLQSITIPSSVTSIGEEAFFACSSLQGVYISDIAAWCGIDFKLSDGNPLFYAKNLYLNGNLVTNLIIPSSVTSIGNAAFSHCSSLQSVTFEEGSQCATIGSSAFDGCRSLQSITIPSSVTTIGDWAFDGCSGLKGVYISDITAWCGIDFKSIDANPLFRAKNLYLHGNLVTNLIIPSSVTSIGNAAFAYCSSLQSITISSSVTTIGANAFYNCKSLQSASFEAGSQCTAIQGRSFYGCSNLENIAIPTSVTTIGTDAFHGCNSLQYNIYDNAKYLGNSENQYMVLVNTNGTGITSCTIHPNTNIIAASAFSSRSGLQNITIPSKVTSIGQGAFFNCRNLESVVIPSSVTSIGVSAFGNCSSLQSITFEDTDTWYSSYTGGTQIDVTNPAQNAIYFTDTYRGDNWYKK